MKNESLFNPLPLPESLSLTLNDQAAQEPAPQNQPEPKRAPKRIAREKSTRSKRSGGAACRANQESRWHRIKGRLAAKVALLGTEKFKVLLQACGVAAGIVLAIVVAIKLLPVAAVLLIALGLGAALKFWDKLRYVPRPF